jgi:hypothetical protein
MQQDKTATRKIVPMMPIFKKQEPRIVQEAPALRTPVKQEATNDTLFSQSQQMTKSYEANKKPVQRQGMKSTC